MPGAPYAAAAARAASWLAFAAEAPRGLTTGLALTRSATEAAFASFKCSELSRIYPLAMAPARRIVKTQGEVVLLDSFWQGVADASVDGENPYGHAPQVTEDEMELALQKLHPTTFTKVLNGAAPKLPRPKPYSPVRAFALLLGLDTFGFEV